MRFPSLAEQLALHERALKKDRVVLADLLEAFMEPILAALGRKEGLQREDAYDSVIDVLFSYVNNPERFIAQKGRLSSYLTQAAKKRVMDKHRSIRARRRREQEFGGVFELQARSPKEVLEVTVEARLAVKRLDPSALREGDPALIGLLLQGEGSTRVLAEAMDLPSMPEADRRRAVKRRRDRVIKVLARLGKEGSHDDS